MNRTVYFFSPLMIFLLFSSLHSETIREDEDILWGLKLLYKEKLLDTVGQEDQVSPLSGKILRKISELEQYWNKIDETWNDFLEKKLLFNEEGQHIKSIYYGFEGKKKFQIGIDELLYDELGQNINLTQKRDLIEDDNIAIDNYKQYIFEYGYNGKISEEQLKMYKAGAWNNVRKTDFSYNEHGDLKEMYTYKWSNGKWTLAEHHTFTYDDAMTLLEELIEEYFLDQVFSTHYIVHSYNEEGQLEKSVKHTGVIGSWKMNQYTDYKYNLKGLLNQRMLKKFKKGAWLNEIAFLYVYDRQSNLNKIYEKVWSDKDGWVDLKRTVYTYKRM